MHRARSNLRVFQRQAWKLHAQTREVNKLSLNINIKFRV